MKIAFYAPMKPPDHPVPSGDRRMARLLMQALSSAGHDVELASRLRSWDDGTRPGHQARIRAQGARAADRLIARWRGGAGRPELWFTYHLYHKAPDWLGPPVSDALDIPYVVAEASYAGKQRGGHWAEGLEASLAAIRRADALIALSAVDAEGLRAIVPHADRIHRLAPFLDTDRYAAAAQARQTARDWCWGGEPGPWLLTVAMMRPGDKQRSYAVLGEALARLGGRDWRLAVAGDGPARAACLAPLAGPRLRYLGAQKPDALARLYAAADLLVWPAINEAYGLALLEAQAAGLPVVAGAAGGVPEVVADGQTGLLVAPGDAAALATAVDRLLGDPERRRAMGRAAAARAAAHHDVAGASAALAAIVAAVGR